MRLAAPLIFLAALTVGCGDPRTILDRAADRVEQVADRVASITDTHESLYEAMLRTQENVCGILDGVTDVESAKAARPRLSAQARRLRDLLARDLALEPLSPTEYQKFLEKIDSRQRDVTARMMQSVKRWTEGGRPPMFELMPALSEVGDAWADYLMKRQALLLAKAQGIDLTPTKEEEAELRKAERLMTSIADTLDKLADTVAKIQDDQSAESSRPNLIQQMDRIKADAKELAAISIAGKVQGLIRLQRPRERMQQAYRRYATAAGENIGGWPRSGYFAKEHFDLNWVLTSHHNPATPAGVLHERVADGLTALGPLAERIGPAGSTGTKLPGSRDWKIDRPIMPPRPEHYRSPPLEGPAVATVLIDNLPKGSFTPISNRLRAICEVRDYRSHSSNGQFSFQFETTSNLQKLAEKIDFAAITRVEERSRTITVMIDPARLPAGP